MVLQNKAKDDNYLVGMLSYIVMSSFLKILHCKNFKS